MGTVLQTLAGEINEAHEAAEQCARDAVLHALKAGRLLIEAKETVKHGEWLPWLSTNFKGSSRTAQAYMRLARELPALDSENAQRVTHLPLREALHALAGQPVERPSTAEQIEQRWEELRHRVEALRTVSDALGCASDLPASDAAKAWETIAEDARELESEIAEQRIRAERELGKVMTEFNAAGWKQSDILKLANEQITFDDFLGRRAA